MGAPDAVQTVTVIGEALIDLVPSGDVNGFRATPGGSPYNVAIGLARLGHRSALMARLADNAFGRILRSHAEAELVLLDAAPHAFEPTTLAVVSLDEHAQASYDFYLDGTADWQWTQVETDRVPIDTCVLHFGSIASWTVPGSDRIHDLAEMMHARDDVLVSYDPNVRPMLLGEPARGRALVERSLAVTHVVKASREDVEWLYPGSSLEHVGARWIELGAPLVVLTDGGDGAHAFTSSGAVLHRPGLTVELVDTVGAGDSFTSGLLSGLLRRGITTPQQLLDCSEGELVATVDEAIQISAITCERSGANPPTRAELAARFASGNTGA